MVAPNADCATVFEHRNRFDRVSAIVNHVSQYDKLINLFTIQRIDSGPKVFNMAVDVSQDAQFHRGVFLSGID
jgi:hypothetical protein